MTELWQIDRRNVRRSLDSLKELGIIAVKNPGKKGMVTVYSLDLKRIADLTRPTWGRVGADFSARLEHEFPSDHSDRGADWPKVSVVPSDIGAQDILPTRADVTAAQTRVGSTTTETDLWQTVVSVIARQVGAGPLQNWVQPLRCRLFSAGELLLSAPTKFHAAYVQQHYASKIESAVQEVTFQRYRVNFVGEQGPQPEDIN